ncbi:MAG: aspartyl-tRNA(Asn)/glutamyl-tRNA(Gln) amidotransferase subunit A [Cyclobacteriaceae bacterium]
MEANSSFHQLRNDIDAGRLTCIDIVTHYLQNIHSRNPELNAFLTVYEQEALDRATEIDKKLATKTAGRLAGMVVGIKDVLCYKDHPLNCGSKILGDFESQFSATCVERLLEEDAIIIGRSNCDEFAMGSSCENSAFGPVRNADNIDRVPGGSSGGAAVSVQADMCAIALGTDTGGSVRQPASFCNVIGFKPTYSRISRHGLASYASTFDTIGIFSNTVEDAALVLEIISGEDEHDSTVSLEKVLPYSSLLSFDGKVKIAYLKETIESDAINAEVKEAVLKVGERLKDQGHQVDEVSFPLMEYALPTYYILTTAEASSNLARYDGVKYGYRVENPENLESMYKKTRTLGFGPEVFRRIMLGTFVLSASYNDAYYIKAQKVRRLIKNKLEELFETFDFIILPTAPTTAFELGSKTSDPMEMYLADLFTVQASVAGAPAVSIPISKDKDGMSIGLQVISKAFTEDKLLAFSKYLMN